jgi:hypothetical protein
VDVRNATARSNAAVESLSQKFRMGSSRFPSARPAVLRREIPRHNCRWALLHPAYTTGEDGEGPETGSRGRPRWAKPRTARAPYPPSAGILRMVRGFRQHGDSRGCSSGAPMTGDRRLEREEEGHHPLPRSGGWRATGAVPGNQWVRQRSRHSLTGSRPSDQGRCLFSDKEVCHGVAN